MMTSNRYVGLASHLVPIDAVAQRLKLPRFRVEAVVLFWRAKLDTFEIASRLNIPEHVVDCILHAYRDLRRARG